MHVTHLSLVDYRSYARAEVDLGPGATTVVGRNGQGKTNLVEALGYAASLSSHRVPTDAPLVRQGAERAVVRVAVAREGRTTLVEVEIVPGRANRARLNRSPLTRPREVLGALRTVLFAPEDLALVKGDPDGRRRFLDEVLVALAPRLAGVRADYDQVLRQRNALLRSARRGGARGASGSAPAGLEVWDEHLAAAGAELLHARLHLVRRVGPHVAAAYAAVLSDPVPHVVVDDADAVVPVPEPSPASIGYRSTVPGVDALDLAGTDPLPGREALASALLAGLADVRARELERGTTLVGPHRDDLLLTLDGRPARGYASHGESWSFALALRLGSWSLLRGAPPGRFDAVGASDEEPVLVLDDVFAELDAGRRRRLASLVRGAEQVIITAAVGDDVPASLAGAVLRVDDGRVEPVVPLGDPPSVPETAEPTVASGERAGG